MVDIASLRLLILINIVYLSFYVKLRLVVVMTKQISDGKEVDIAIS